MTGIPAIVLAVKILPLISSVTLNKVPCCPFISNKVEPLCANPLEPTTILPNEPVELTEPLTPALAVMGAENVFIPLNVWVVVR